MKHMRTVVIAALLLLATVKVMLSAAPQFTNASMRGGSLVLKGSGGINYGPYILLTSTNLMLPQSCSAALDLIDFRQARQDA